MKLKVVTQNGDDATLTIESIVSVDGKPFIGFASDSPKSEASGLEQRVQVLEQAFTHYYNEWRTWLSQIQLEHESHDEPPIPQENKGNDS